MSGLPRAIAVANQFDRQALRAYKAAVKTYARLPWVTGVGIGIKETRGQLNASAGPVIVFYVTKKLKRVPKQKRIPREILGVPTDVVQGNFVSNAPPPPPTVPRPQPPSLPLRPGASVARSNGSAESVGGIAQDAAGVRYMLTAEHVFIEKENLAAGSPMVHPGPLDLLTQMVVVARYHKKHKTMDAGIAKIDAGVASNNNALLSNVTILPPTAALAAGTLEKSGRTTDITQGVVRMIGQFGLSATVIFIKPPDNFTGTIADHGDSGAIWYDADTFEAVGLHRGSDPTSGDAVATPVGNILSHFKLAWV